MGHGKINFFYLYSDAQYNLKIPARVVPNPLFLPIYVIMTSFPQNLVKCFSFVDFYFIHSHFFYGWIWISKLGSLNKWDIGNFQMHLWRHMIMTSQCRNKNVTKIVKNYRFQWLSTIDGVLEDTFWSPWPRRSSPWLRSLKSSKIALSLVRGQHNFWMVKSL